MLWNTCNGFSTGLKRKNISMESRFPSYSTLLKPTRWFVSSAMATSRSTRTPTSGRSQCPHQLRPISTSFTRGWKMRRMRNLKNRSCVKSPITLWISRSVSVSCRAGIACRRIVPNVEKANLSHIGCLSQLQGICWWSPTDLLFKTSCRKN